MSKKTTLILFGPLLVSSFAIAEDREFKLNAVDIAGTKYWIPSNITVKKGDKVKLKLTSQIPGKNNVHGFAIDAFKVQEAVDGKGKTVEFVADQVGVFPMKCHMHPAHVGGQLVVLE